MLKATEFFASYSVDSLEKAKEFYSKFPGLHISENKMGILEIRSENGQYYIIYPKKDHKAANFTVMNFEVENIEEAVTYLRENGVQFEQYEGELQTDEKGIFRRNEKGPAIAWFKDPAGNILSVIEE